MSFFQHRFFLLALRVALGCIFLYAGAIKIGNPQAFADSLATFHLFPPQFINLIALGLPAFEVLLGLVLISGWQLRASSLGAIILSVVFGLALGQALVRGLQVDCGCFGPEEQTAHSTLASLTRAVLLTFASYVCLRLNFQRKQHTSKTTKCLINDETLA